MTPEREWKISFLISCIKNFFAFNARIQIGSGPDNFDIPFFAKIEEDGQSKIYRKEKKKIEKIYRGKDLVEVTLNRLGS